MESVVVLSFPDRERAHDAMGELHRLEGDGALRLQVAAIVEGAAHGLVRVAEDTGGDDEGDIGAGATVGALLDAATGPVGLGLRGAAATVVGSLLDIAEAEESGTVVAIGNRSFPPRKGAVVAVVDEVAPGGLEDAAAGAGASLVRQSRADVERELADARRAETP